MINIILRVVVTFFLVSSLYGHAAISFITSVTRDSNDDKASLTVPASVQTDDLLLVQVAIRNRSGSDGVTTPAGWTLVAPQERDDDVLQSLYYRVATVADPGTSYEWDFDGNGNRRYGVGMSVFRGVDTANPLDAQNSQTGMSGTSVTAPSVTTSANDSMLVGFYALEAGDQSFTPASGMSEIYDEEESNNNNGITFMASYVIQPSAGASGNKVATASKSNDDAIGHLVALNTAASSPLISSVDGACANLNNVTVVFSEDVSTSTAQLLSNYSLVNAASSPVTINSAVLAPNNTVTLTTASNLNDLTQYTLTVNNVEDLDGNAIAVNSTDSFMLSCGLNCISDNFTGPGSLSSSWSVGNSSGSFGDPRIVDNGRLRLTDASGNVATVATLLNKFPGADNRVEVEFDYYAYDGSGADGIAVTFSDASIPPASGGYGGSLGYAQLSGGIDGFAGGWLGIGLDEYGNFSNPTEGRQGGTGFSQDSVTLRGSGSGTAGYPYLTGTGTLSPGVDQSGGTPNPGHRYKIIIDHTMGGGEAYISVERDTGSGYVEIVPRFDIYTVNPSQATVPNDWVVSFTGSTGGSSNIHEMGALQVCAAQPIETFTNLDHFSISHSGTGINCQAEAVTITAVDSAGATDTGYTGTVNLTTSSNNGDWTLDTGAGPFSPSGSDAGTASYTFVAADNGSVILNLKNTHVETISINVTDGSITETSNNAVAADDPDLVFSQSGFVFLYDNGTTQVSTFPQQISARPLNQGSIQPLLRAITTDPDTGVCTGLFNGVVTVELAVECVSPSSCSSAANTRMLINAETIDENPEGSVTSYKDVNLTFAANSTAVLPSFIYEDAGQIKLHARYKPLEENILGSSANIVFKPAGLCVEATEVNSDCAGLTGCTKFKAAAAGFSLSVRAMAWEIDGDTNYCANNNPTPGFTLIDIPLTHTVAAGSPAGSINGTLGDTDIDLVNGIGNLANQNISEVGAFNITATPAANSYFTGTVNGGTSANIGRFYPASFVMTGNSITRACGAFSYMGQPSGVGINYSIQALNGAATPAITQNYIGGYIKATQILVAENNNDGGDYAGARLSGFTAGAWTAGVYNFAQLDSFSRLPSFDGPYQQLSIGVAFADADGNVSDLTGEAMNAATNTDCTALTNCDARQIGQTDVRFGRMRLSNIFGPETQDLTMGVFTEYYAGAANGFITNTDDSCSTLLIAEPPVNVGPYTGTLSSLSASGAAGITAGLGNFTFPAPGLGNQGSALITYSPGSWLQTYDGDDADNIYDDDPKATVTFGQFRGHDRVIYWREIVR